MAIAAVKQLSAEYNVYMEAAKQKGLNKRVICSGCGFPQSVCICDSVQTLSSGVTLYVLQHPNEAGHAKNTGRLLTLCMPDCRLLLGESPADFPDLIQATAATPQAFAVVYPSDASEAFETKVLGNTQSRPENLILIDATWRKAFRIWQQNPWLHPLPAWHFDAPPESQYQIRKTSVPNGISTLEAAAYVLNQAYQVDVTPLYRVFEAMQNTHHGRPQ